MAKTKDSFGKNFSNENLHKFLGQYIGKKYPVWRKKYPNITGVDLAKKRVAGEETEAISIVFHVITKTDLVQVNERIPPFLIVVFSGKRIKVQTDLIATGNALLNYLFPGGNVFQYNNSNRRGTIGLIVYKAQLPHLLSNMHVLGWSYLAQTRSIIDRPINEAIPPDVNSLIDGVIRPAGYFKSGCVNQQIDAAIALISPPYYNLINPRTDIIRTDDPIVFPSTPVTQPIPVRMLGMMSGFIDSNVVSTIAVKSFPYPFGDQTLVNLIALSPCCSQPGDSGSAVYEPQSGRIIGIILGRDENLTYSYVIPYSSIQLLFQLD